MAFVKKSISVEQKTNDTVDKISEAYGIPKSCVFNIAVSRPDKFKKLMSLEKIETKEEKEEKSDKDRFDLFN